MARKPTQANDASLQLLKELVEKKSALPCNTFSQMPILQSEIRKVTGETLSIQTLNRFFGLVKNGYKPSATTLDVLAKYVNYDSFRQFELLHQESHQYDRKASLSFETIKILFSGIEAENIDEKGLLDIMRNLHQLVERDPELGKDVYPFMASHWFGRKLFFERFVHLDGLNHGYGSGLKHCLMHTRDRERHFFAHTILCWRYFLSCQQDKFDIYFEKLKDYSLREIETFHPFSIGRYYAIRVFDSVTSGISPAPVVEEALAKIHQQNMKMHAGFPGTEYVLGQALVLIREFDLAWKVLKERYACLDNLCDNMDKAYHTQYKLLYLSAGFFSGQIGDKKAIALLNDLQGQPLYFLTRKFYSLLLNDLYSVLRSGYSCNVSDEFYRKLVDETGFVYFHERESFRNINFPLMDIKGKKIF